MTVPGEYEAVPTERTPLAERSPTPAAHAAGGVVSALARPAWIVAASVALALVIGAIYLAVATKVYTASAVLMIDAPAGGSGALPPDEYLAAQRDLLLSSEVLSAGAGDAESLRRALRVRADTGDGTLTVTLDAASGATGTARLSGILDNYFKLAPRQQGETVAKWRALSAQRDEKAAQRAAAEKALLDFKAQANVTGTDADRTAATQLEQLQKALAAARAEADKARADADAAAAIAADPAKLRAAIDANRAKGKTSPVDQQKQQIEAELAQLEAQLAKQRQTLLPQHPAIQQTQRKIDLLQPRLRALDGMHADAYRAEAAQAHATAAKNVVQLQARVDEQATKAQSQVAGQARHAELEAALKRAESELAEADKALHGASVVGEGSSAAPAMKLVQSPRAPERPSRPDRMKVLSSFAAAGLMLGAAVAFFTSRSR